MEVGPQNAKIQLISEPTKAPYITHINRLKLAPVPDWEDQTPPIRQSVPQKYSKTKWGQLLERNNPVMKDVMPEEDCNDAPQVLPEPLLQENTDDEGESPPLTPQQTRYPLRSQGTNKIPRPNWYMLEQ